MSGQETLSIGEVAATTGVMVSALRYYDEVGIVTPTERVGGKRRFGSDAVGRVNFIKRAQRFGFSLDELRHILDGTGDDARKLASSKLEDLRTQQAELQMMIELLAELIVCGCDAVESCPKIERSNEHDMEAK